MPRFAANLTLLFTEAAPLARPGLAAAAGFAGAEILFPYDHGAKDWAAALSGLPLALINTPPGDWAGGERGFAAMPDQRARFRDGVLRALDHAAVLRPDHLHVMAGLGRGPEAEAEATLIENLIWTLEQSPDQHLTIEPLNPQDMPGYFLDDFDLAARVIAQVGNPRLGLQYDLWHAWRIEGDALGPWHRHAGLIRHIQIAGFPHRQEPDGQDFDHAGFFSDVDASGYSGWLAAEYIPAATTEGGLGWLPAGTSGPSLSPAPPTR